MLCEVVAQNLCNVGLGGSNRDRITDYWRITTNAPLEEIQQNCERNYLENCKRNPQTIQWFDDCGGWRTQDLGSVMYRIKPVVIV